MRPNLSERALVLAPLGRDARVACAMLGESGLEAIECLSLESLVDDLVEGAGFAVVAEEALSSSDASKLARWIAAQPEWSDFPFVLLTQRGGGLERNPAAARYLSILGNVTFLERPFHPTTLVSIARAALRGRRRQYEARARLEQLNELAADLERKVEQRTEETAAALVLLHEAQKLETLGQLTGGVAHDFNNLLTPISGTLELLQRRNSDERSDRLISNALLAADRAKTLVQRLLGFARRQELQTQPTNLGNLLAGMRDLIASSVGSTIILNLIHDELPLVLVDPNQLELAILNLCVNARDSMPDGGILTLSATLTETGPRLGVPSSAGQFVRLSVIDEGTGMDAATLARAVEPFFSTKETGRGTGLGLSMVHGLAAQLGGSFVLTSQVGIGTKAELYLPVAENSELTEPVRALEASISRGRALSILIVDDEDLVRLGTAEMLRDLGHHVAEARGGDEALNILKRGEIPDVVVTDYKMPRMDGAELAKRLGSAHPTLPVLVITGYTGAPDKVLNWPRLAKPFSQAEIAAALLALTPRGDPALA